MLPPELGRQPADERVRGSSRVCTAHAGGRPVFVLAEDLRVSANQKAEAVADALDNRARATSAREQRSNEDPACLLDVLTTGLQGLDSSLQQAQARSRDFIAATEERSASKKREQARRWEPFKPFGGGGGGASSARPPSSPRPPPTPRCGTAAGGAGPTMPTIGWEAPPEPPKPPKARAATAGPKLKALNALEECPYIANVHNVMEVQQIPCGTVRVDTKVDYYREHDLAAGPLMEHVERRFMMFEAVTGELLVNVPRLGKLPSSAAARIQSSESRAGYRSGFASRNSIRSPFPTASPGSSSPRRSPSPRQTKVATVEDLALTGRERAQEHSERMERAVVSAREQQMDKRVQHLRLFQQRQARHERATRGRPWLTWVVAGIAMAKMKEVIKAYLAEVKQATVYAVRPSYTGEESWNRVRRRLRMIRSFSKLHAAPQLHPDTKRSKMLRAHEVAVIQRVATQKGLEHAETRRRDKLWRLWMHAVRVAIFAVRARRPLKTHMQMEIAKKFIAASWKGFRTYKIMKNYVRKVKLVALSLRQTHLLMQIIKQHILLPQVWVAETLALGEAVGVKEDGVQSAVDEYLEAAQIDHWRAEVLRLMQNRSDLISGKIPLGQAALKISPPSVQPRSAFSSPSSPRKLREPRPSVKVGVRPDFRSFKKGGTRSRGSVCRDSDPDVGAVRMPAVPFATTGKEKPKGQAAAIPEAANGSALLENVVGRFIDEYRLQQEERELIAANLWRENLERWWQVYKLYKDAVAARTERWRQWLVEASRLGPGHRELWPHEPSVQHFPMELMEVHIDALRQRVIAHLRQGRAAAVL